MIVYIRASRYHFNVTFTTGHIWNHFRTSHLDSWVHLFFLLSTLRDFFTIIPILQRIHCRISGEFGKKKKRRVFNANKARPRGAGQQGCPAVIGQLQPSPHASTLHVSAFGNLHCTGEAEESAGWPRGDPTHWSGSQPRGSNRRKRSVKSSLLHNIATSGFHFQNKSCV